jgi:hypothetical protein
MAFRFRRIVGLGKLLRFNLSKSGVSMSAGVRGARFNFGNRRRKPSATVGIPGTGVYFTKQVGSVHSREVPRERIADQRIDDEPETEQRPSTAAVVLAGLRGFWAGAGFVGVFGLLVVLFVIHAIWGGEGLFWFAAGLTLWIVLRTRSLLAKEQRKRRTARLAGRAEQKGPLS